MKAFRAKQVIPFFEPAALDERCSLSLLNDYDYQLAAITARAERVFCFAQSG